jgi:hypothetical protein
MDYLAEYNKISKPANYDPCQNATQLCNEAFDSFVQMPRLLARMAAEWPDDFNKAEQDLLQKWLIANTDCFQKFRSASQRSYYWVERHAFNGDLRGIEISELGDLHCMCEAILWNAKINAAGGKYSEAFEDILASYRISFQRCGSSRLMIELRDSLWQQQMVLETASLILTKIQVSSSVLNSFQQELEKISKMYKCSVDFTAEKLRLYDILQRIYVYKPDGSGRLSCKGIKTISEFDVCSRMNAWQVAKNWLTSEKFVKNQIDSYYQKVMLAFTMTPWQLNQTQPNYFKEVEQMQFANLLLSVYGSDYKQEYYCYYDTQAQLQALLTTIAIMQFRQDNGRLPSELDELIKAGYLQEPPIDPYSDKPLVYKLDEENFKIYSIGDNFKDDGGKGDFYPTSLCSGRIPRQDIVFWPPWKRLKNADSNLPIQDTNQPLQKPSE